MRYCFQASGHQNISGLHQTTFEFTSDSEVSTRGDCILGVNADFDRAKLSGFLTHTSVRIRVESGGIFEEVTAVPNPAFRSATEFVVRTTDFISDRTFATCATKPAASFSRKLVGLFRDPVQRISICIEARDET